MLSILISLETTHWLFLMEIDKSQIQGATFKPEFDINNKAPFSEMLSGPDGAASNFKLALRILHSQVFSWTHRDYKIVDSRFLGYAL